MKYTALRKRVSDIIEVGYDEDFWGRCYDVINLTAIVVNLTVTVMMTFEGLMSRHSALLQTLEIITVVFFTVDYLLRIWTAPSLFPQLSSGRAVLRYAFSFNGLVDMLSSIPYFLPVFFPSGVAAFRILRIVRIFRLFRVNAYFDSLNVITAVLKSKAKLLISSVFIIFLLMLASSLCMYSIEHSVQPNVFDNALSGLWWAAATLLTVGYGDIYPVTALGKIVGMILTMLGVGIVAIPTGIISAGFVEQYTRLKKISEQGEEDDVNFIQVKLTSADEWNGLPIKDLQLPSGVIVASVIKKDGSFQIPHGDVKLGAGDVIVLGAEKFKHSGQIELREITLKEKHEWVNRRVRDLDISRRTFIVMIRRNKDTFVPNGDTKLLKGDKVFVYSSSSGRN